jgi:hypothetical protein
MSSTINSRFHWLSASTVRSVAAIIIVLILVGTGIGKVVSALGNDQYLEQRDLITGLSFKLLLVGTSGVEFVIARLCWAYRQSPRAPILVLMLCVLFGIYRITFSALFAGEMCPCLGYAFSSLGISKASAAATLSLATFLRR